MATISFVNFNEWTEKQISSKYKDIVKVMKANQLDLKQTKSSLKRGDFSKYKTKFETRKLTKQVTRSYGSFKAGKIGVINGFKGRDESWRMLNVLLHDRQLHQRWGRTLVTASHKLEGSTQELKRNLRRLK